MTRRARVWLATFAIAVLAAGAGAGLALWRLQSEAAASQASATLFGLTLPDADGRPQTLAQWRGRPLVINFWATWCAPCVEEMPDLQRVRDEYHARGVEIIGLGIDTAYRIRAFRDDLGLTLPLLVAGAQGSELARALGNSAGALPYTVLIAADGRVVQRRLGRIKPEELRRWLDTQVVR
ncbi:MAG: TlpA disulfide reductase family protein [Sutterellaceae bacterium]|nr:TlpA family protein disulfide reductase [Burkholderiaceae bacterium]MCX7901224.1 TlpA family protein disulfide reductase [Burkholderiaceae bacterium]MDW8429613.1 TlpA disulfide reductase family protein [Sutterellaceae bacterium]